VPPWPRHSPSPSTWWFVHYRQAESRSSLIALKAARADLVGTRSARRSLSRSAWTGYPPPTRVAKTSWPSAAALQEFLPLRFAPPLARGDLWGRSGRAVRRGGRTPAHRLRRTAEGADLHGTHRTHPAHRVLVGRQHGLDGTATAVRPRAPYLPQSVHRGQRRRGLRPRWCVTASPSTSISCHARTRGGFGGPVSGGAGPHLRGGGIGEDGVGEGDEWLSSSVNASGSRSSNCCRRRQAAHRDCAVGA